MSAVLADEGFQRVAVEVDGGFEEPSSNHDCTPLCITIQWSHKPRDFAYDVPVNNRNLNMPFIEEK